jgi:cyclase
VASTTSLNELGDGVYAWLQPGGESGVSNAGVVVDDDGITVIDTLMVRSQWEPFVAAVEALDAPIRRTVLTHAHIDHCGGTKAFTRSGVYGSQQTSDVLDGAMPVDAYKAFMPAFEDEFDDLEELGTRGVTHIVTGPAHLTRRVELLPAEGHTEGDLVVLVADADVCFAGDLCFFGVTPLAFQGNPAVWADMLDAIADLAGIMVPGHGPAGGEREVRELQAYLRACADAGGDVARIPSGPWDTWLERERDAINVERAELLARGENEIPVAMLRAMGFA